MTLITRKTYLYSTEVVCIETAIVVTVIMIIIITHPTLSVAVGSTFEAVCLFVCLSVCLFVCSQQ